MERRILKNSVYCNHCKNEICSFSVHDYKGCECPPNMQVCVDGGNFYLKRAFGSEASYKDTSVYDNGNSKMRSQNLQWGSNYTKDGKLLDNTLYRNLEELEDEHIYKILEIPSISKLYRDTLEDLIIDREEMWMIDNPDIELKW